MGKKRSGGENSAEKPSGISGRISAAVAKLTHLKSGKTGNAKKATEIQKDFGRADDRFMRRDGNE